MAWGYPQLPLVPVLLFLLTSGSWQLSVMPKEIPEVVGSSTAPRNEVTILSTASPTFPTRTTTWLQTSSVKITSPKVTSGPSISGSAYSITSSPVSLGWAFLKLLVSVLCGLLMLKGLVLTALCVALCCWRCKGNKDTAETIMMEVSEYASPAEASEHLGGSDPISGSSPSSGQKLEPPLTTEYRSPVRKSYLPRRWEMIPSPQGHQW